ncbi:unnamed protein product [Clavelina lepadiformis]|uniref:Protein-PII uridylyltransferase N-terminal domain-containing protein n=1 Tax=Clavelina lepadiformis TaxID=159417 RepID=A0ABP0FTF0_CLALP
MMAGPLQKADLSWGRKMNKMTDRLKEFLDKNGKEKDAEKSASIFHQMGLLYMEKSEQDDFITKKLTLIRSAALLNAAVTRQPGNEQFQKSLKDFCSNLLQTAGAKILKADLLEIAKIIKKMAEEMRRETEESLVTLRNISYDLSKQEQNNLENEIIANIKTIQTQITLKYKNMMKFVSKECEKIMGNTPCKYSITGMGSLARCEITPYSDFEHIILLEEGVQKKENYPEVLEYFRWFSVIFQTIIINLQETILPSVAIPNLEQVTKRGEKGFFDAFTKRGISFDFIRPYACHFPLGRMEKTEKKQFTNEFIKPVSEMLKYLDKDEDLKNGYNIPNVLITTCQVYGDNQIYQQIFEGIKDVLRSDKLPKYDRLMQQLNEDLQNFDAFDSLNAVSADSKCNIKRLVYRTTTLFISALGQLNSIDDGSSFAIIDQLNNNNEIDDGTAHLLSYAVAVSCQVRLKVYMEKESQDDYVGENQIYGWSDNKVYDNLMSTVGEKTMVDYFAIAYKLQNVLRRNDGLSNMKFNITLKPFDKFKMLHMLNLHARIISEWESYSREQPLNSSSGDELFIRWWVASAYSNTHQYNESLLMLEWLEERGIKDPDLKQEVMRGKAWCLFYLNRFQEVLQFIGQVKAEVFNLNLSDTRKHLLYVHLAYISGWCQYKSKEYQLAIDQYMDVAEYAARIDQRGLPLKEIHRALWFYNIGDCLFELGHYDAAMNEAEKSQKHYEQHNGTVRDKCKCYSLLGRCHLKKEEYTKASIFFRSELDLRLQFVPNEKKHSDKYINFAKKNIQICQENVQ